MAHLCPPPPSVITCINELSHAFSQNSGKRSYSLKRKNNKIKNDFFLLVYDILSMISFLRLFYFFLKYIKLWAPHACINAKISEGGYKVYNGIYMHPENIDFPCLHPVSSGANKTLHFSMQTAFHILFFYVFGVLAIPYLRYPYKILTLLSRLGLNFPKDSLFWKALFFFNFLPYFQNFCFNIFS